MMPTLKDEIESIDTPPTIPPKVFNGIRLERFKGMRQTVALSLGVTSLTSDRMNDAAQVIAKQRAGSAGRRIKLEGSVKT